MTKMIQTMPHRFHRGRGFLLFGHVQLVLYLWGISAYAPWRWFPGWQVGQIDGCRWWRIHRIGPDHMALHLLRCVYIVWYWPERKATTAGGGS